MRTALQYLGFINISRLTNFVKKHFHYPVHPFTLYYNIHHFDISRKINCKNQQIFYYNVTYFQLLVKYILREKKQNRY